MNKVKVEVELDQHIIEKLHLMLESTHKYSTFDNIINTTLRKALPESLNKICMSLQLNRGLYHDLKDHAQDNSMSISKLLKTLVLEELESGGEEEC